MKIALALLALPLFLGIHAMPQSAGAEEFKLKLQGNAREISIAGPNGKLHAVLQLPVLAAGQKCPVVIICHGFSANCERPLLVKLANDLVSSGIGAMRFDFDGCGQSDGKFENMTVPREIADLKKIVAWVEQKPFTASVSLAGHSQGGVVASMLAGEYGYPAIHALALLAPAAVLRDDALRGITMGASYDPWNVPETIAIPGKEVKLGREYVLTAQNLPIYDTARKYTGPVFIVQGTHDRVVPYTYAERYQAGYKNSDLILIDGSDHSFSSTSSEAAKLACGFFTHVLLNKPKN